MSHKKLRQDKNCLNCGNIVEDRYCSHCGQENLQIQDSFFHLLIDYIKDIFHYDGRFWHTLKSLILKPGLVAKEYMEGKRGRNLEPLRFYLFSSSLFFLLLFYFINASKLNTGPEPQLNYKKRLYNLDQEKKFRMGSDDTTYVNLLRNSLKVKMDTLGGTSTGNDSGLSLDLSLPESADSADAGWFEKWYNERAKERSKELTNRHEGDEVSATSEILMDAFHKLPQLLFFSMPFFAFFLKILYIRRAKRSYAAHFIFSIYHYSFLFINMTLFLLVEKVSGKTDSAFISSTLDYVSVGLVFYVFIYLLLSMKRFYDDRWRYLIPRYILLMSLSFVFLIMLFLVGIFVTYLWL